jgi:hypothetical protein
VGVVDRARAYVASTGSDGRLFTAAYLLLLPLYLAPLWVTAPLFPGLDLPFHLSLADMLAKGGRPDSPYAAFYQGSVTAAPYAAHYLALWLASRVTTILTAHTALVVLYVAGLPLAAASLLKGLGRSRVPALLAFPLAYNMALHYGFISFAFSLPVLLLFLAQLSQLLLVPAPITGRWLLTAALAVLLFLCHLQNFIYGVGAAVVFVLFSAVPWRRRLASLAALLPAVAVLGWWYTKVRGSAPPAGQALAQGWQMMKVSRLGELPGGAHPWLADLKGRLLALPANTLRGFTDRSDVKAASALLLLIGVYFCMGVAGRYLLPGPRSENPRMRAAVWLAFLGALAAYLLLPHHLNAFEIVTFFPRFAPLVLLMMLPLVSRGLGRYTGALGGLLAVPAVVFCAVWGVQLCRNYHRYADETADFRAVIAAARPGHRLINLPFERRSKVMSVESALIGLGSFYPLLRPAPGSMVPLQFCGMRHIPCVRRPPLDALPDPTPWAADRFDPAKAVPFFDYFLVRSPILRFDPFGEQRSQVELVARRNHWSLYKRKGLQ